MTATDDYAEAIQAMEAEHRRIDTQNAESSFRLDDASLLPSAGLHATDPGD